MIKFSESDSNYGAILSYIRSVSEGSLTIPTPRHNAIKIRLRAYERIRKSFGKLFSRSSQALSSTTDSDCKNTNDVTPLYPLAHHELVFIHSARSSTTAIPDEQLSEGMPISRRRENKTTHTTVHMLMSQDSKAMFHVSGTVTT